MELGRHAGDGEIRRWGDWENRREVSTPLVKGGRNLKVEI